MWATARAQAAADRAEVSQAALAKAAAVATAGAAPARADVAVTAPVVFLMKVRRLLENESLGLFIAAMLTPTPAEPSTSILFKLCRILLCWINLFGAVAMV